MSPTCAMSARALGRFLNWRWKNFRSWRPSSIEASGNMRQMRLPCLLLLGLFAYFVVCHENQVETELESEIDEDGGGTSLNRDELVTSIERVPRSTSISSSLSTPYDGKIAVMRRSRFRKDKNEEPAYYRHGHKSNTTCIFIPYFLNFLTNGQLSSWHINICTPFVPQSCLIY